MDKETKLPQPKHQVGDKVWVMIENRAMEAMITGVLIIGDRDYGGSYRATVESSWRPVYAFDVVPNGDRPEWHDEKSLYPSKEELIASL